MKPYCRIKYYDSIKESKVDWLWYPFIPYGKITIVQGDPGEGKTTMMLQIAANLTRGKSVPDGDEILPCSNVIFQGAEDGQSDTIKPRLIAADADCSRVAFIDTTDDRRLSLDDDRFEEAIRETDAKLLIIDPLQAFVGSDVEISGAGSTRAAMARLAKIADETGCAVVLIGHLTKGSGGKGIYRGLGSIDVAAAARSILLVGRSKDNPTTRIIVQIKSSLAPEGESYSFELNPESGFKWIGRCDYSADEVLGITIRKGTKLDRAKEHMIALLSERDMYGAEAVDKLQALGIGRRTIDSARRSLGVKSYKQGNLWYWHLDRDVNYGQGQ